MPIYEFTCHSCGLRFEELYRRVSDTETHPCPSCGAEAVKQVSAVSFKFNHPASQKNGHNPPNTGTSDDWNYDKAIGADAEMRWQKIHENREKKQAIIKEEAKKGRGITMDHLVKTRDGGYRTITEPERKRVNANREAAFAISQAASTQAKSKDKKE